MAGEEAWTRRLTEPGVTLRVFSATKARDREVLGERVTEWLRENKLEGVFAWLRQSSDAASHCMSITVIAKPKEV